MANDPSTQGGGPEQQTTRHVSPRWVMFRCTLMMASGLLTVDPSGGQMLSYQYSGVGLPPLLTVPSRRSARQLVRPS